MANALLTVLANVSAGPLGPDDSLCEAQKRCKGGMCLFSYAVADPSVAIQPPDQAG